MEPKNARMRAGQYTAFQDPSVIAAYGYRPPYPVETFAILAGLLAGDAPRRVLDLGCGTGLIARALLPFVDAIDAVDVSAGMIAAGKRLPGGDDPRINWIVGRAEEAALAPPYALATAGDSLHWMDWHAVLPNVGAALAARGVLAIIENEQEPPPWHAALLPVIRRYSTIKHYVPFKVADEVERLGLFAVHGRHTTAPVPFVQSVDDYVASFHGRSSFSRERMTPGEYAAFDAAVRAILAPYDAEPVTLSLVTTLVWGRPIIT